MEQVILIGIGGMLLFAIGIIVFVLTHQKKVIQYQLNLQKLKEEQQKLLLRAAISSEEKERQRIAGDLHDEVGASLSTIRLYLIQAAKKKTLEQAEETSVAAKEVLDEVIGKVRQISHRLTPEMLMKFGLKETLQNMFQKLASSDTMQVSFRAPDELPRLESERELAIYRIVQEVLNNTLKHAEASFIHLNLCSQNKQLIVTLENDGKGFDQETFELMRDARGGLGLKNIQNRVNILNAKINFGVRRSGEPGTLMTLEVPMEK